MRVCFSYSHLYIIIMCVRLMILILHYLVNFKIIFNLGGIKNGKRRKVH